MSGFLTEENRAFLKDRHLSEYALSSLDRGNGVIFYPEKINLMLDEARAPDWQDISTAPRDGTDVLIGLGDTIAIGFYCPENDPRLPPGWIWAGEDLWFRCEPTHWMPLPAPPKRRGVWSS